MVFNDKSINVLPYGMIGLNKSKHSFGFNLAEVNNLTPAGIAQWLLQQLKELYKSGYSINNDFTEKKEFIHQKGLRANKSYRLITDVVCYEYYDSNQECVKPSNEYTNDLVRNYRFTIPILAFPESEKGTIH